MRYLNRLLAVAATFGIVAGTTAHAYQIVPPNPETQAVERVQQSGPGAAGSEQAGVQTVVTGSESLPDESILAIQSEGAIVINANTGEVLYAKNPDVKYYPASITKLLTALLVIEQTALTDTVTFSEKATTNLESGSVSLGVSKGDRISVKDCLYGLLLKSANEVANGLAEHTAGSVEAFVAQMNARAQALGCTNTNFTNPHGLNNANHYTTPRDMAKIAREVFNNATLRQINNTTTYTFPATQKSSAATITLGHKMLHPTDTRYYEGIIGGKTGYTSLAGNTLVTAVEKDGVRLIAVIMKSKSTHYADTKLLLDYGFSQGGQSARVAKWVQDKQGTWYYYQADGNLMKNQWLFYQSQWYYLGSDGKMLTDTNTPDGYYVNAKGVWLQS